MCRLLLDCCCRSRQPFFKQVQFKNRKKGFVLGLCYRDTFHTVSEIHWVLIFTIFSLIYFFAILIFAIFWVWAADTKNNDPCELDTAKFSDAFVFSAITMTTIGYGSNSLWFNNCVGVTTLLTFEALVGFLLNALLLGTVYTKISRGKPATYSMRLSDKILIRTIRGKPHLLLRVCDARRKQLIECHVRVYCIRHHTAAERQTHGYPGKPRMFQQFNMRLQSPDDDLGAMLLPSLPFTVVHRIDRWSPLHPANGVYVSDDYHDPLFDFKWPEVPQRMADKELEADNHECCVCGESYRTPELLRRHTRVCDRDNGEFKCSPCPSTSYSHADVEAGLSTSDISTPTKPHPHRDHPRRNETPNTPNTRTPLSINLRNLEEEKVQPSKDKHNDPPALPHKVADFSSGRMTFPLRRTSPRAVSLLQVKTDGFSSSAESVFPLKRVYSPRGYPIKQRNSFSGFQLDRDSSDDFPLKRKTSYLCGANFKDLCGLPKDQVEAKHATASARAEVTDSKEDSGSVYKVQNTVDGKCASKTDKSSHSCTSKPGGYEDKEIDGVRKFVEGLPVLQLVVVVEGVEHLNSCTVQATKVYTRADIVYEHDFESCTEEDPATGACVIDFDLFDCVVPVAPVSSRRSSSQSDASFPEESLTMYSAHNEAEIEMSSPLVTGTP